MEKTKTENKPLKKDIKKDKKKKSNKGLKITIGIIAIVAVLLALTFSLLLLPWKNVYMQVGKNRITYNELNYQVYLASQSLNAQLPNLNSTNPKELAASRNVLQLAYVNLISNAILYNKALEENISISEEEVNSYIDNLKNKVAQDYNDKDLGLEVFLDSIGVQKDALKEIVQKMLIAQKEEDVLTKDITVSKEEVVEFYNNFWSAYVDNEKDKATYFEQNYEKIKADTLKSKKSNYVQATLRPTLVRDHINDVKIDNPYKAFMRFWYGSFLGTNIPEVYKAISVQELLT